MIDFRRAVMAWLCRLEIEIQRASAVMRAADEEGQK
jgi:hypothetical protein